MVIPTWLCSRILAARSVVRVLFSVEVLKCNELSSAVRMHRESRERRKMEF